MPARVGRVWSWQDITKIERAVYDALLSLPYKVVKIIRIKGSFGVLCENGDCWIVVLLQRDNYPFFRFVGKKIAKNDWTSLQELYVLGDVVGISKSTKSAYPCGETQLKKKLNDFLVLLVGNAHNGR